MGLASVVSTVIGLTAFAGAGLLGPDRDISGRAPRRGSTFGTRRPHRPPPGRRVPPRSGAPVRKAAISKPAASRIRRTPAAPAPARWARPRDLGALVVATGRRPQPVPRGRLVLGRAGRSLVAAEPAQSVIVFGPTQSRKTSGFAIPAILGWEGPVVAASIKTDLIDHTIGYRRSIGQVRCFDPSGSTGLEATPWSPLPAARTWPGARRAAAGLTEVAKSSVGTMSDGDFWYATATKMLAPLLFAAAFGARDMADVVRWVDTQEQVEVLELLHAAGVPEAIDAAYSAFGKEDRQRSSIYTTVETILDPFADPAGPTPSDTPSGTGAGHGTLDPARLVGGANTLYLCAPAHDQRRLTPLFVSVVREVVQYVYDLVAATHRPLDPPLLIVLDEAANIAPLADLDALASTAAGHGVQLVTVWHDLSQINARYGPRATTVVNNHRAKLFLSGIADPSTLDYASHLVGEEEVLLPARTMGGRSGPSTTHSPSLRKLAPPDALRRIPVGQGVLVYGDLPPAHLHLRSWFTDPGLLARAQASEVAGGPR